MNRKKIFLVITMLILGNLFIVNSVKAEDVFDNDSNTEDVVSDEEYQMDDEEIDNDEEKTENIQEFDEKIEGKKGSFGVVLTEIFCGIVGLFMLFLAFKANEN